MSPSRYSCDVRQAEIPFSVASHADTTIQAGLPKESPRIFCSSPHSPSAFLLDPRPFSGDNQKSSWWESRSTWNHAPGGRCLEISENAGKHRPTVCCGILSMQNRSWQYDSRMIREHDQPMGRGVQGEVATIARYLQMQQCRMWKRRLSALLCVVLAYSCSEQMEPRLILWILPYLEVSFSILVSSVCCLAVFFCTDSWPAGLAVQS